MQENAIKLRTLTCTTRARPASEHELYTVAILSFISAGTGRAKQGRISQHNVVRSNPTYTPASLGDGGKAFEPAIHLSWRK